MVQGTGSNVGKSTLVAGLARAFARRGIRVLPFKPQNTSNNAAITEDGGEIGRAQSLQAQAARVPASVHMNPVLLKPQSTSTSQIIVQGRLWGTLDAANAGRYVSELLAVALQSFDILAKQGELILVEGAGSPAEINLRSTDMANMQFAAAARVPVVLVGDIDRGGVIASIAGTRIILEPQDANRIRGFIINKFRGDENSAREISGIIETASGWPGLGTLPWLPELIRLPAEDVMSLPEKRLTAGGILRVAIPILPSIANFDDLDPLLGEKDVQVTYVRASAPLPADATLVIVPGSKSTVRDLLFLRQQGWDVDIAAHVRRGGHILGICGGYQMLGKVIVDAYGVEGAPSRVAGLGFLDVETSLTQQKTTRLIEGRHLESGKLVRGYEIHMGETQGADCARPLLEIEGRFDGASSPDGRIQGTYVHGLLSADEFRRHYLSRFGVVSKLAYDADVDAILDRLADCIEANIDVSRVLEIARSRCV